MAWLGAVFAMPFGTALGAGSKAWLDTCVGTGNELIVEVSGSCRAGFRFGATGLTPEGGSELSAGPAITLDAAADDGVGTGAGAMDGAATGGAFGGGPDSARVARAGATLPGGGALAGSTTTSRLGASLQALTRRATEPACLRSRYAAVGGAPPAAAAALARCLLLLSRHTVKRLSGRASKVLSSMSSPRISITTWPGPMGTKERTAQPGSP